MNKETLDLFRTDPTTLYIAGDLSALQWKLAATDGSSYAPFETTLMAFDTGGLLRWIESIRTRLGLPSGPVVFCCEAGRDGFSVHRTLESCGIPCLTIDPASIETSSRARKAKTDRLDARRLLKKLRAYVVGDRDILSPVQVPTQEVEDERRMTRERERLVKEASQHQTRIKALLATQGIAVTLDSRIISMLKQSSTAWGTPLGKHLRAEILRELERLELVQHQLAEVEAELAKGLKAQRTKAEKQGALLYRLKGIGLVTACTLPREFFWRHFNNRGQVGAAAGLTGTPFATGTSVDREQGISKVGNKRVRTLMIEIAWGWVRHQPDSPITQWFRRRTDGTKRSKRKAIVAVARKLLIALWHYVTQDIVPAGVRFKTAA